MSAQYSMFVPDGWRDCADPACAAEWGPMPPREFRGDPARKLCTVCYLERAPEEAPRVRDRLRYTPARREAIVRRNRERMQGLGDAERRATRERKREYDRRRYLARRAS